MDFSPVVHFFRCATELMQMAAPWLMWVLTPIWIVALIISIKNIKVCDGDVVMDIVSTILFFALSAFGIYCIIYGPT
jgi:hypothetical protein